MVIQTLGQKDKGLHLPDWLCGRIPREVTSLWGGTTPTIRLDPQASGFFTTNIVVEKPSIQRFARKSKKSGSLLFSMSASKLLRKSSKHRVKVITKTKKVISTLNATHPPTRHTSKGQYQAAKPLEEDANKKIKEENLHLWPLHGPGHNMNSWKVMQAQTKFMKLTWSTTCGGEAIRVRFWSTKKRLAKRKLSECSCDQRGKRNSENK